MAIDPISSLRIMTPQKTSQGNDYKKSNIGKYVGGLAGAGFASKFLYDASKVSKSADLKRMFIPVFDSIAKSIDDYTKSKPLQRADFRAVRRTAFVNGIRIGIPVVAALKLGAGLAIGAIGDGIANSFLRKHADKTQA
ncbi:MAG: hypothetical protein VZR09_09610 [Candidatus Gastranaerophilaceae bacterium]|nr:hypothetical protein [Candidatus Gastranaerophilaceae bacterium]